MMQQLAWSTILTAWILYQSLAPQQANLAQTLVHFTIKNAGFDVEGTFAQVHVQIRWDEQAAENCFITAQIPVNSINTGIRARDRHLLKEDYFYAAQYPAIQMKSRNISHKGNQNWEGKFDLTMRGVTKTLTIPFSYQKTDKGAIFSAQFSINRLDFQVGKSSWLMGDEVKIRVKITL
ncbi:MAG: YceI family protein [Cytophagales bacterium]|nr:YceI family protein [Cytophagales bacterium]